MQPQPSGNTADEYEAGRERHSLSLFSEGGLLCLHVAIALHDLHTRHSNLERLICGLIAIELTIPPFQVTAA